MQSSCLFFLDLLANEIHYSDSGTYFTGPILSRFTFHVSRFTLHVSPFTFHVLAVLN